MWHAERAADRATTQHLNISPEELRSPVQRRMYDALTALLDSAPAQQAAETLLLNGVAPAPWYAWRALECFRTAAGTLPDEGASDGNDQAREEARALVEIFCDPGSALFVPVGDEIRATIERVLMSTPDHIDIGRKLFLGMQSKIMVEMERFVLDGLLRDGGFRALAREEGVVVVAHLSLAEILAYPELRRVFAAHLSQQDQDAHRLLAWLSLDTGAMRLEALQENAELRLALGRLVDADTLASALEQGRAKDARALEIHVYFHLRDSCLTEFMWTEQYLQCLSTLAGVDLATLSEVYESRDAPEGEVSAPTERQCHRAPHHLQRPTETETKFGDVGEQLAAESALGGATLLTPRGEERERSRMIVRRLINPFRRQSAYSTAASAGARKIGLAPAVTAEQLRRKVRRSATPRDWKYAYRCCCEREPRAQTDIRIGVGSGSGSRRRAILGLEGIMAHSRLRQGLKKYLCAVYRPEDQHGAALLRLLRALREGGSAPTDLVEDAAPLLTHYVDQEFVESAPAEELERVCTNIFAKRFMPLLTALSALSQAAYDN